VLSWAVARIIALASRARLCEPFVLEGGGVVNIQLQKFHVKGSVDNSASYRDTKF
jgi:hypothetical protein